LIPAKEEQAVIARTLQKISQINYPRELYEVFVVWDRSDDATIIETRRAMQVLEMRNGFTLTFGDTPVNKPHGLNKGLKYATKDHIVIFDAEDDVHPDVLNIANTLYGTTNTDVIQAGVQIVDYTSHWYSSHYVLEYYFWFKSRMHFHSSIKMVPLGGNTVFFKTALLREAGGWDETCLTEDAEIGIRLSSLDARIMATYDPRHVTKEETPPSIAQFIKQRTRWNQGFIQILRSKVWHIHLSNRLYLY
jgi:cellulose synthase/poly-beta-1,6-N-acetylglucosamine synthase-like glycosyltransferase